MADRVKGLPGWPLRTPAGSQGLDNQNPPGFAFGSVLNKLCGLGQVTFLPRASATCLPCGACFCWTRRVVVTSTCVFTFSLRLREAGAVPGLFWEVQQPREVTSPTGHTAGSSRRTCSSLMAESCCWPDSQHIWLEAFGTGRRSKSLSVSNAGLWGFLKKGS